MYLLSNLTFFRQNFHDFTRTPIIRGCHRLYNKKRSLGHYSGFFKPLFLDFVPHAEYNIENVEKKQWRKALPCILKIIIDFCLGILLVWIFSKPALPAGRQAIIYVCAIVSTLPDSFTVLNWIFPNKILEAHNKLNQKIHFFKYKKISMFWRIATQVTVVIISIVLLRV